MSVKAEILRAICFTEEDLKNIQNLGEEFLDIDISFVVEFKKIYELGLPQLKKFIDKLESEGKDLDVQSIIYYKTILLNGPLGTYVREYSKDKKYFGSYPDSLGLLGNFSNSGASVTNTLYDSYPLGASVDTFNKLPDYIQKSVSLIKTTEDLFRSSVASSTVNDNTLPLVDKKSQDRYNKELNGGWSATSNATYLNMDVDYIKSVQNVSQKIFDSIKESISEENFRIFEHYKTYSPFDAKKNTSKASNISLDKEYQKGDKKEIIKMDLLGDVIDSEEKRARVLKIEDELKDLEYKLNTNTGQLGS